MSDDVKMANQQPSSKEKVQRLFHLEVDEQAPSKRKPTGNNSEDIVRASVKAEEKFYIIYKTTNLISNKFYIGIHKTNKLEFDGYLGSGAALKDAIKKYGKENFKREILYVTISIKEVKLLEKVAVNKEFVESRHNYNLTIGGCCRDSISGKYNPFYGKSHTEATKAKLSKSASNRTDELNSFYGKKHSTETKQKISQANKGNIYNSLGWWHTPFGKFKTSKEAAKFADCCEGTLKYRCRCSDRVVGFNYQIPKKYHGNHTWRDIGWFIERL